MQRHAQLANAIYAIGEMAIACPLHCEGIVNDPSTGTLPRSLILELDGRSQEGGSAVLGINPGHGREVEKSYYLDHGNTYESLLQFWKIRQEKPHPYHLRTKRFLTDIGLDGPILWTELAKCESSALFRGMLPLQTIRTCIDRYLMQEIAPVPHEWPIVALGRKPFELSTMLFRDRRVLGIPHPTGSRGNFDHLLDEENRVAASVRAKVASFLQSSSPIALWVTTG